MRWSDEAFRTRVAERARTQGRSVRQVLADAGMSHDTLEKIPSSGRRLDTLDRLAEALDWSLEEIMGFDGMSRHVAPDLLLIAYQMAVRVLRNISDEDPDIVEVQAEIYDVLIDKRTAGVAITPDLLEGIASAYESGLRKRPLAAQRS
jgi:hypothetical protein